MFGKGSVRANNTVVFGDNVVNNQSDTFVFNGKDASFIPAQPSAFYANSKVAINGASANATLDIHGGLMLKNQGTSYAVPQGDQTSTAGIIALFSRGGDAGLCGYDAKANRRVPLSESARKFGLCVSLVSVAFPEHAISSYSNQTTFSQFWNQTRTPGTWESPKWIYGNKDQPQHFICAKGYVPDVRDPIGKTGVRCIPCNKAEA